jgi:hypothetical protein
MESILDVIVVMGIEEGPVFFSNDSKGDDSSGTQNQGM